MRTSNAITLIAGLVLIILLVSFFGGGMMGWGMTGSGHMWDRDGGSWWGITMWLAMILFWIFVIAALAYGVSWLLRHDSSRDDQPADSHQQPIDILRERYARGEISKEEFDQIRKDLE